MGIYNDYHKALWDWCMKNPEKEKRHWPGWSTNGGKHTLFKSACFLCKMACGECEDCPGTWGPNEFDMRDTCESVFTASGSESSGLYDLWVDARIDKDWGERIRLAQMIRDIVEED